MVGLFSRKRSSYQGGFAKYHEELQRYGAQQTAPSPAPFISKVDYVGAGAAAAAAMSKHVSTPQSQARPQSAIGRSSSLTGANRTNSLKTYTYHPKPSYQVGQLPRRYNSLTNKPQLTRQQLLPQPENEDDLDSEDYIITTKTTKVVDSLGRTQSITTKTVKTLADGSNIIETTTKNISRSNSRSNSLRTNSLLSNSNQHLTTINLSKIEEDLHDFDYNYMDENLHLNMGHQPTVTPRQQPHTPSPPGNQTNEKQLEAQNPLTSPNLGAAINGHYNRASSITSTTSSQKPLRSILKNTQRPYFEENAEKIDTVSPTKNIVSPSSPTLHPYQNIAKGSPKSSTKEYHEQHLSSPPASIQFKSEVETIPIEARTVQHPQQHLNPATGTKNTQSNADMYAAAMQAAYKKVYGDRETGQLPEPLPVPKKLSPKLLSKPFGSHKTDRLLMAIEKVDEQGIADKNYNYENHHKSFIGHSLRDAQIPKSSNHHERLKQEEKLRRQSYKEELLAEKQAKKEAEIAEKEAKKEAELAEKQAKKDAKLAEKESKKAQKSSRRFGFFSRRKSSDSTSSHDIPKITPLVAPGESPAVLQQSAFNQPSVNQPTVQQPNVQQPNVQQPNVQQPNVQQPNVQQPAFNQPTANQPASNGLLPSPKFEAPQFNNFQKNLDSVPKSQTATNNQREGEYLPMASVPKRKPIPQYGSQPNSQNPPQIVKETTVQERSFNGALSQIVEKVRTGVDNLNGTLFQNVRTEVDNFKGTPSSIVENVKTGNFNGTAKDVYASAAVVGAVAGVITEQTINHGNRQETNLVPAVNQPPQENLESVPSAIPQTLEQKQDVYTPVPVDNKVTSELYDKEAYDVDDTIVQDSPVLAQQEQSLENNTVKNLESDKDIVQDGVNTAVHPSTHIPAIPQIARPYLQELDSDSERDQSTNTVSKGAESISSQYSAEYLREDNNNPIVHVPITSQDASKDLEIPPRADESEAVPLRGDLDIPPRAFTPDHIPLRGDLDRKIPGAFKTTNEGVENANPTKLSYYDSENPISAEGRPLHDLSEQYNDEHTTLDNSKMKDIFVNNTGIEEEETANAPLLTSNVSRTPAGVSLDPESQHTRSEKVVYENSRSVLQNTATSALEAVPNSLNEAQTVKVSKKEIVSNNLGNFQGKQETIVETTEGKQTGINGFTIKDFPDTIEDFQLGSGLTNANVDQTAKGVEDISNVNQVSQAEAVGLGNETGSKPVEQAAYDSNAVQVDTDKKKKAKKPSKFKKSILKYFINSYE